MDWIKRMTDAVQYIEDNILDKLDYREISSRACTAPFHFQRMFHMLTGFTLGEYIRRRRLTLAAQEIATTRGKIIGTALKYGYESHASFTKAFVKLHGFPPAMVRGPGIKIKAFPPITFNISITGGTSMDYRIIESQTFKLVGKMLRVTTKGEENFRIIPEFWQNSMKDGSVGKLEKIADRDGYLKGALVGAILDYNEKLEEFDYLIGIEYTEGMKVPEGMDMKEIPGRTYSVFNATGPQPETIQDTFTRIYSQWFPATKYIHSGGPELEVYPVDDLYNEETGACDIWIPIMKEQ